MSSQTLHPGSLRPATIPAITVLHPGLQVHSIAAPQTDRRLSFLMSANLYCAFAAGAVLVAQAAPAIHKTEIKTEREFAVVDLVPLAATQPPVAVAAPRLPTNIPSQTTDTPAIPEPQPVDTDKTPTGLGTKDFSDQIAHSPASTPGTGRLPGTSTAGGHAGDPPSTGQPLDVSASSVSVLQQIQPNYPSLARLAHKQGDVVLIMTINEQGVPTDVKMASGDAIFKGDAIRAAQQWRFTPAQVDGQARSARFRLTLQFRLRG